MEHLETTIIPFGKKEIGSENTAMVVSTGSNSFGHPSNKVIDFFLEQNFIIYLTSQKDFIPHDKGFDYTKEVLENLEVFSFADSPKIPILTGIMYFPLTQISLISNICPAANTDNMGKLFVTLFAFAPALKTNL